MRKIIEATHHVGGGNWGRFKVERPDDEEWSRLSAVATGSRRPLLAQCGWSRQDLWVMDLVTCEGLCVSPGGSARADLNKHQVRVCPMFEWFLAWLYAQDLSDLAALPDVVYLPWAPFEQLGYRRAGPDYTLAVNSIWRGPQDAASRHLGTECACTVLDCCHCEWTPMALACRAHGTHAHDGNRVLLPGPPAGG